MKIFLAAILSHTLCYGIAFEDLDITGETNYHKSSSEALRTTINLDYKIKIFEPSHGKYMLFLGGRVTPDYDHFGNTIRLNGFTHIGIEF